MSVVAAKKAYRPEIEGLRALAAGLVAVFHVWLGGVSGGVDVFFVVSGFLVTTTLVSQHQTHGRVVPLAFWANLAKRLFPSAFLVIFVTAVVGILVLPQVLWVDTIRHAAASLVYLENWQLAFDAVNYLAQGMEATPYQHYWALAVQGQFYVLWPLLMLMVLWGSARRASSIRRRLSGAFVAVFLASLCYSVIATRHNQQFAYYDTLARVWEFALGGLLAVWIRDLHFSRIVSFILGWMGLVGLLACGFILDVSNRFPGYVALLPTLSAVCLLISGNRSTRGSAAAWLSKRPFVSLGGISYAFYLWHWPVLIFFRHLTRDPEISLLEGSAILAVALMMAIVSTRLLENPVRTSALGKARPIKTFAVMALLCLPAAAAVGGWAGYTKEVLLSDMTPLNLDDPNYPGARALSGVGYVPLGETKLHPSPVNARRDRPKPYADQCQQQSMRPELLRCAYGKRDADTVIAIVGGSHSVQWVPAFEVFAEAEGYKIVNYTKSFCLFSSPEGFGKIYEYPSCTEWNARLMDELIATQPDLVFTLYSRDSGEKEHVPQGYLDWFHRLAEHGIRVLAVRDNPWMPFEPSTCVELHGVASNQCRVSRDAMLSRTDPADSVRDSLGNVSFIDFSRFFCDADNCFPEAGNVLIYRDSHHITTSYMRTLAAYLRPQVKAAMNHSPST
ncbi:acyltransferase family protein [Halomonas shantousis]